MKQEEETKETPTITEKEKIRQTTEKSNLLAKKLQKESFHTIWEFYKAKEDIEKLTKGNIAAHFFYLGAKTAFSQKSKDYTELKKDNENKKIDEIKTQKKLREIKRDIFKIKKDKGLDIKNTIKLLNTALKKNKDNATIEEHLEEEIEFLEKYEKNKQKQ